MEDEDDPVIEEIPVFISNTLAEHLYLLQYPIKDNDNNFDTANVVNCCVKPYNEQIKVDFAVSTKSKNYDAFRGEQLAQQADGVILPKQHRASGSAAAPERPAFPGGRMDKLSYTSSKPSEHVSRYVIGVLSDREVHLTPLKTMVQMRPSFSYFDKKDTREKVEQKAKAKAAGGEPGGGGGGEGNSGESDDEDVRQVTVKFQMTDRVRKMQEKSFEHHAQRQSEEPWCETMWYPSSSGQAELERRKLYSNKADMIGHSLGLDSEDYIKNLIPPERKEISIDSFVPSKVVHCAKRMAMSLSDQIKHILIDAKIASFQQIVDHVDKKRHSRDKILQTVAPLGVLLHGNWVIESDLLYPDKTWSRINGIPAEYMCRARDYILFQFTKKPTLSRHKLAEVTQLPAEELKEILESVSTLNKSTKEWELALAPDHQFEKQNSDLVDRQNKVWQSKEKQFEEMEAERPSASGAVHGKRSRKRSIREAH